MGCKEEFQEIITRNLKKHISLVNQENAVYEDSELFLVWSWAGINQISIQEAAVEMHDCNFNVPSGDTILHHISKQPYQVLEQGFDETLTELMQKARKHRLFTHPVVVAIDFTDIEWYGEDLPYIVHSQQKNGTNRFIRFASLGIVEDGKRFIVKILPVTPLSSKENIVTRLIQYAQQLVDIRVILLDRGFYTGNVIQNIDDQEEKFIIPVVRQGDNVKQMMKTTVKHGPQQYTMTDGTTYRFVTVASDDSLLPYATNMTDAKASVIHELYSSRFGIETQYRVKNRFLGRTCSKKYSVRNGFFVLAVCLYNIWIMLNIAERGRKGIDPGKIPIRVDRLKHIYRLTVYPRTPR